MGVPVPQGTTTETLNRLTQVVAMTQATKRYGLAEMRIGDQQRGLIRQPHRTLRQQPQGHAADHQFDQLANRCSAMSRCSVGMRRKPERA